MSSISFSPADKQVPDASAQRAAEVRQAFTQFAGQTFFSQMMKAMRATQGKPAYFHGGRAEEVFRSQLDQQLVDHFSESAADRFAEPMFRQQFPKLADKLAAMEVPGSQDGLDKLSGLRRLR